MCETSMDRRLILAGILASLLLIFAPAYTAHAASSTGAKAKTYASDTAITTELKARFLAEKDLDSLDIKVETTNGIVTLRGQVIKESQSSAAERIARSVKGVRGVRNKISIMP